MKISEIKNCSSTEETKACIKCCWENELYHYTLCKYNGNNTEEAIYNAIRLAFVTKYPNPYSHEDSNGKRHARYLLQRLCKAMYGDNTIWSHGTEWEEYYDERENKKIETAANLEKANALYELLDLDPKHNRMDIIKYAAAHHEVWSQIEKRESEGNPVKSREDLYQCFENAILPIIEAKGINYSVFHVMSLISFLAFHDKNYWVQKNNLGDYETLKNKLCSGKGTESDLQMV